VPQQIDCPLCHRPAAVTPRDFGARKHYECAHCKEFVVTTSAERLLARKTEERLVYFSGLARKGWDDSILVIDRAPTSDPGEQPTLQSKFLSRRQAFGMN
jgi:hypothetical protein